MGFSTHTSHHETKPKPIKVEPTFHSCANTMSHKYNAAQVIDITAGTAPDDLIKHAKDFFDVNDSKCPIQSCALNAADKGVVLASSFKGFSFKKEKTFGETSDFEQTYFKLDGIKETGNQSNEQIALGFTGIPSYNSCLDKCEKTRNCKAVAFKMMHNKDTNCILYNQNAETTKYKLQHSGEFSTWALLPSFKKSDGTASFTCFNGQQFIHHASVKVTHQLT